MPKPQKIASKDLKKFLDANKRVSRLTGPLERFLLVQPPDDRPQDVLHPSDLIKSEWCALHAYHALQGNYVPTADKAGLRLQSIFDEGHAIHDKWQKWIWRMGNLYGKYSCLSCGSSFFATSPEYCEECPAGTKFLEYKEVPMISDRHRIHGHADGWVKGLGDDYLIEIKSIGSGTFRFEAPSILAQADGNLEKAWTQIRQPFRAHILQGQMYLHIGHLMVEAGLHESFPEEIVYIYELKSNQDYKEFSVKYDKEYIAEIFEHALDVVWAVDNNRPPACNIDPVNGCKRCSSFREETNV